MLRHLARVAELGEHLTFVYKHLRLGEVIVCAFFLGCRLVAIETRRATAGPVDPQGRQADAMAIGGWHHQSSVRLVIPPHGQTPVQIVQSSSRWPYVGPDRRKVDDREETPARSPSVQLYFFNQARLPLCSAFGSVQENTQKIIYSFIVTFSPVYKT